MLGHPGTPENRRNRPREFWRVLPASWPTALRDGITEDDLNSEGAEVHSGGTDVVSFSSTQLVYVVYGVVELFLDRVSALWTSRSMCSLLTPQGVEGRWQWSSLVAVLGTAQHAQPAALTAFLDR